MPGFTDKAATIELGKRVERLVGYRDDDGQQADFHALRHTYLSRLGRSGASPKAMQSAFGGLDRRPSNSRSAATRTPTYST